MTPSFYAVLQDKYVIIGLRSLLCVLASVGLLYALLRPSISPVAVIDTGSGTILPISSWSEARTDKQQHDVTIMFHVRGMLPVGKIQLYVDDCLNEIAINGMAVEDERLPYCNWFDYLTLDVGEYLHAGSNTISAVIHNGGGPGSLTVTPARASWLFRAALWIVLSAISAFGIFWLRRERDKAARVTIGLLIFGTLLRVFYAAYTDYDTYAYDWAGHLEYMHYIADHWVLPKGNEGWEFHQQPLYYIVGGAVFSTLRVFHATDAFIGVMQILSLLLSLGSLYACGIIASQLFPARAKHAAAGRFVFLGLLATLPGIIMFSSRINNDVPTLFFAVCTLACLFAWWKKGTFDAWVETCVLLSLALLTKSSALPLIAPVGLALLLRRESLRSKMIPGIVLGSFLLFSVGGTVVLRGLLQGQQELVPVWVTSGLHVKNFAAAYYMFNPWQILQHPFNHNWIDDERRQYLWEYFLRSAFFGEWEFRRHFGWQAPVLLTSAMLLIPACVWGAVRSLRRSTKIGLILLSFLALSLLALASFRYLHPNSSNQEIRYIMFVTVPIAYFLARAVEIKWMRWCVIILSSVMFVLCSWLLIVVAAYSR